VYSCSIPYLITNHTTIVDQNTINKWQKGCYNQQSSNKRYHGTSATTSGWLKILAAACLLLVGMGSPAGVYASHIT